MRGRTEQVTTIGKNLFDVSKSQPGYYQGAQGNLIEYDENFCVSDYIQISDAQNKLCISTLSESTKSFVVIFNENKEKIYSINNSSIASRKGVIDIPTGAKYVRFSSRNIENIQVEYSDTPTDFEPYTDGKPSPSIEYPQEIVNAVKLNEESGKYKIDVKVTGRNLINVDALRNKNGYIGGNYIKSKVIDPFEIVKGKKYLLITKGKTFTKKDYCSVYFGDATLKYGANNYDWLHVVTGFNIFDSGKEIHVTLEAKRSATITNVMLHGANNTGKDDYEVEKFGLFELLDRETTTTYEPYKEPQTIPFQLDRPLTKWDRIENGIVFGVLCIRVRL